MEAVKCDLCKGKSNKEVGFEYQVFNEHLPIYSAFMITRIPVDICAKCYADIFNKPELQKKLKLLKRHNIFKESTNA